MKTKIYPEGTFEDIISFPFNTERVVGIVVGVVLLSGMFFLATTDNKSIAPKKFANEKVSLREIWTEEKLSSFEGFRYPWILKSPEYNPETKQFIPNNVWN